MPRTMYYRTQLAPPEVGIYDALVAGFTAYEEEITVPYIPRDQMDSTISRAMLAVTLDYPDFFFVQTELFRYRFIGTKLSVCVNYRMPKAQALTLKRQINARVDAILRGFHGKTELEVEEYLQQVLTSSCTYLIDDNPSWRACGIVGALIDGACVCSGFSSAMKYLADRMNLYCISVQGAADGGNGRMGPHEWNIVRLGPRLYHVDITFNSAKGIESFSRAYFNLSDAEIRRDHRANTDFFLPVCPVSGCTLRTANSTAELAQILRRDYHKCLPETEVRLGSQMEFEDTVQRLCKELGPGDRQWYNAVERYFFFESGRTLRVLWKR